MAGQTVTWKIDTRQLDAMARSMGMDSDQLVRSIAYNVEADIKTSMKPGNYRVYKRTKDGRVHRSSSPGSPPAPDTGALKASIETVRKGRGLYWVQDGVEYGIYLELGTSRVAARPFMVPAIERAWKWFEKRFEELFR